MALHIGAHRGTDVTGRPGPTGVPAGTPTIISLDPTLYANQSNSPVFTESAGSFGHTIAISIIADELAINPGAGGANWSSFPAAPERRSEITGASLVLPRFPDPPPLG
jgi:hypothetical protein